MRGTIVAVDLETTGLDPDYDRIIEIGAVKFQGDEILDEWQSLVDPGCPIPPSITQLTGISDGDVEGAPRFSRVLPQLRRFIGAAPVLGHNVRFDLNFLSLNGLSLQNTVIDTYALASVLRPDVPRYSLSSLAVLFGVPIGDAHRALADAYMTAGVYGALWKKVLTLPLDTLAEIVRAGHTMPWDGAPFFEAALKERAGETFTAPDAPPSADELDEALGMLFSAPQDVGDALRPRPSLKPLDLDEVAAVIEPGGKLAEAFPDYEHRAQQVSMLRKVAGAFNEGKHILVEAPTGVGKSLAYLLPAARFAVQNNKRVIVSTNTINLQEQLINKDTPLVQAALNIPLRVAVLKGRANYLCPRRLAALRRRGPTSPEEMQMLARLLVWLTTNRSGDRGQITLRGPVEQAVWRRLSAEDEGCTLSRCFTQMGGSCPFYQARRAAEAAHIVIVNHALLLSDVTSEGRVLPDYDYLVVDEVHHLEGAITNGMSFRTDADAIKRRIAELGTPTTGLLGETLRQCRGVVPEGYFTTLEGFVNTIAEAASFMGQHVDLFFEVLQQFLRSQVRIPHSEYAQQVRILEALRRQPAWAEVGIHWDNLSQFTSTIAKSMDELLSGLSQLSGFGIDQYDDLLAGVGAAARHLQELHRRLEELVSEPDPNTVYWAEFRPEHDRISLHAAPLNVGPLVQEYLWDAKETIVMTSATMRTDGSFAYIRDRLSADGVEEVVIGSPFDYESSTLLYLVNDIPEPANRDQYQSAVEEGVLELCRATEGRALVLFTSYAQLRRTSNAIADTLAQEDIVVYDQSRGISRMQLLEGFLESEKSVLMGTRSFWEGIDIPGADLSVLVIVRLPFSVPSDPLFAARGEQFSNPFMEYAVPEAILRFRQGFGRLIRRRDDRGVVAIFDRRVISKRYGHLFLDSLPQCTVRRGRLADLPAAAIRWLAMG
jgi:ATP-dependent DNA helicase DinG